MTRGSRYGSIFLGLSLALAGMRVCSSGLTADDVYLGGAVQQHGYCPLWLRPGYDVADQHQQELPLHHGSGRGVAASWCDCGMYSLLAISTKRPQRETDYFQSVYYLGCAIGAVLFSTLADRKGRKPALFGCLAMSSLGNLIMFVAGLGYSRGALAVMYLGRIIMGLGVGGVDSVVPVYSSELSSDGARGKALAQEFQSNIFGLNMAFAINLAATVSLSKQNEWAWRIPIIAMQVYPLGLLAFIQKLPESPRWFIYHDKEEEAKRSLADIMGDDEVDDKCKELVDSHKQETESGGSVGYIDMLTPGHAQFHPTVITIMGQVNQALTGYGAVSVYGPQIFELLGYGVQKSEFLTQGNYVSYFVLMTFAWLLIDAVGRRALMLWGSALLTLCFLLLCVFAGLENNSEELGIPSEAVAIPGIVGESS
jgi:MFS family permease